MKIYDKILLVTILTGSLCFAGSLQPTAAPGPTMKTLDQVEPRIPIPGGNVSIVYTISSPGSYYLTGNRTLTSAVNGIVVEANDVTIDLCGYALIGSGGAASGIYMRERSNVVICNGTIRGFGYHGISEADITAKNDSIINVRVIGNNLLPSPCCGISLEGSNHRIKDCTIEKNGNGILVGKGCIIQGNTINNNNIVGIVAGICCTIQNNSVYDNGSYGIYVASGCTIQNNTIFSNNGYGIYTTDGCTIMGNSSRSNENSGIRAGSKSVVIANSSSNNTGNGIFCLADCLVDQNAAVGNSSDNLSAAGCTLGTNHTP